MITSLIWILFWALVVWLFMARVRFEKRRDEKANEMSEHRVELREKKANETLWNLLEKDDPQFLREMGIEMPQMRVFDLEREFDMLEPAKVEYRNAMLREQARAHQMNARGVQQLQAQIQGKPGEMIYLSQGQVQQAVTAQQRFYQMSRQQQNLLSQTFGQ